MDRGLDQPRRGHQLTANSQALGSISVPEEGQTGADAVTGRYRSDVDHIDKAAWHGIVAGFADANLYQTWSHGAARWGEESLSRLVLRRDGEIVAAAQAAVVRLPVLGIGVAQVRWGPMWRLGGQPADPEILRHMLRAMRDHFVTERGLVLRVHPYATEGELDPVAAVLDAESFALRARPPAGRTFVLDLSRSLDELRSSLKGKWRYNLKKARARDDLTVEELNGQGAIDSFMGLYTEMHSRKRFSDFSDIEHFPKVQADLPSALELKVVACRRGDTPVAAIACWAVGDTAFYHFGATGNEGIKLGASYLVHWRMIERLKELGCGRYLIGGASAEESPGLYQFKSGLAGKLGSHERFLAAFEAHDSVGNSILVRAAEQVRDVLKLARARLAS